MREIRHAARQAKANQKLSEAEALTLQFAPLKTLSSILQQLETPTSFAWPYCSQSNMAGGVSTRWQSEAKDTANRGLPQIASGFYKYLHPMVRGSTAF
jgi:hypothetical protein